MALSFGKLANLLALWNTTTNLRQWNEFCFNTLLTIENKTIQASAGNSAASADCSHSRVILKAIKRKEKPLNLNDTLNGPWQKQRICICQESLLAVRNK